MPLIIDMTVQYDLIMQYQVDPMLQTQETHFQIVQKYIFLISESSSMSITIAKACKPFRSIKILKKIN